jgi:hypothetical protein
MVLATQRRVIRREAVVLVLMLQRRVVRQSSVVVAVLVALSAAQTRQKRDYEAHLVDLSSNAVAAHPASAKS